MSDVTTKQEIAAKVKGYILAILAESNETLTAADIVDNLNELSINSIDFLELIIKIENEFDIDIPDEMLVEKENNTIPYWAEFISKEVANKSLSGSQ